MQAVRSSRRLLALAAAGLTAVVLLLPVPVRGAEDGSVTISPRAEAWYRTVTTAAEAAPTCDLPIGCAPAVPGPPVPPPSPYPPGFLHVGVGAGLEESRTYVALDLEGVPADGELIGGTLTLPITPDPTAGNALPETAKVRACHVETFVKDGVAGDLTGAPPVDCTVTSSATYVAAADGLPAALTVDLVPFLEKWDGGVAAVALLPEGGLAPTENWHVAFSRRDRQAADVVPISARLDLAPSFAEFEPLTTDDFEPPLSSVDDDFTPAFAPDSFAAPPLTPDTFAAAPVARPPTTAAPAPRPVAPAQPIVSVVGGRFKYPGIFLLPLLIAAAIAWTGRAFTRELR